MRKRGRHITKTRQSGDLLVGPIAAGDIFLGRDEYVLVTDVSDTVRFSALDHRWSDNAAEAIFRRRYTERVPTN